ncbi:preprotein translocase subunit SecA [Methylococcus sp. EFPC2]|uniref:preprotein translocase subunit SecA n=1 Tax=Methylococcus sp. EFPC2 TaxID=2812648 RepID=UPI001967861B|nr:preprotein translocase subunit SecA [Methylococcus sp. EFPC2]QSA97863.1 preprotein translocase subunit SecA [Methylococcus sp. EFPC2]
MHEILLPSPGLTLGHYPERPVSERSVLERLAHGAVGWVRQRRYGRISGLDRFVAEVNRHEADVAPLASPALEEKLRGVRFDLVRHGLRDDVVARAFALIREVSRRTLGLRHFDVQVMGGWLMLNGLIAEMETGEGKTLTATLPACTAALAGVPVHIVTVNDYLVKRDANWAEPLCRALGLTVGAITQELDGPARQQAYACDITYCTSNQLVFDYLKDRLTLGRSYSRLQLQMERLGRERERDKALLLRGLCYAIVDEADSVFIDEARTPLIISQEKSALDEQRLYQEALELAGGLQEGQDFMLMERARTVELTPYGKTRVAERAASLGGIWRGKRRQRELVVQALSALHLFVRDRHYIIADGKVQIVDEFTGRVMADRSWERGLHQLIEAKEGCALTSRKETLAKISYQQFFRRYLRLAGMTGTAKEVAGELWAVYGLNVVRVPTHRPIRRVAHPVRVFPTAPEKWQAIVERIAEIHARGRPVLVGTRSVAASEHLSGLLIARKLPHQVLNARQDAHEADLIAAAGERGSIVVATNMAGRGTDIKLAAGVVELGGLHVIATEIHESGRIDRQLFGRGARQGDPGSYEMLLALDDELVRVYGRALLRKLVARSLRANDARPARWLMRSAQDAAEKSHSRIRRGMLKMDEQRRNLLAFSGTSE